MSVNSEKELILTLKSFLVYKGILVKGIVKQEISEIEHKIEMGELNKLSKEEDNR